MVLLRLEVGEVGEAVIEGGLEVEGMGLELGEVGGEREVLLLEEGAGLLGGDGGGVELGLEGVELPLEVADESVGFLGDESGIV